MTTIITIICAALANFIIGFLFHGPIAGKLWMKLADVHPTGNEKFKDMIPQMVWNFVANLVTAYVLWTFVAHVATTTLAPWWLNGPVIAIWMWAGFIVTSSSIEVIWMKRRPALWLFECGVSLICFIAMGIILAM